MLYLELIRYKLFDQDLLLLELVNAVSVNFVAERENESPSSKPKSQSNKHQRTQEANLESASIEVQTLYEDIKNFIFSLGDDIQQNDLKHYTAFKRLRNFTCLKVIPKQDPQVRLWLKIEPNSLQIEKGFSRDVSSIGHYGTGNLEITIRNSLDCKKAYSLIERSYQEN